MQLTKFKSNFFHLHYESDVSCKKKKTKYITWYRLLVNKSVQTRLEQIKKDIKFLKKTKEEKLTLEADDTQTIDWYIDAAFGVHDDMKSHTGACMNWGKGMICAFSNKQKVNSRSSIEAELIAVDDEVLKVMWTKQFI